MESCLLCKSFYAANLSPGWFCKSQICRLTRVQLALTKGKCLQECRVKPKFGCTTLLFSASMVWFRAGLIPCARRILSRKESGNGRAWNDLEESWRKFRNIYIWQEKHVIFCSGTISYVKASTPLSKNIALYKTIKLELKSSGKLQTFLFFTESVWRIMFWDWIGYIRAQYPSKNTDDFIKWLC